MFARGSLSLYIYKLTLGDASIKTTYALMWRRKLLSRNRALNHLLGFGSADAEMRAEEKFQIPRDTWI